VTDVLIIGYGNELRGDDGLGPFVAESIAAAKLPGVVVKTAVQLLPELAADLAEARLVVFVDASMKPGEQGIPVRLLAADDTFSWCTHRADPHTLLALTQAIYGRTPETWWLAVSGLDFDYREGMSDFAKENAQQAIARLTRSIQAKPVRSLAWLGRINIAAVLENNSHWSGLVADTAISGHTENVHHHIFPVAGCVGLPLEEELKGR
jgi:hydrogenase maturation protease